MAVRSSYAESKRAGESLCVAYYAQFGVPAVIVRPFHIYGPGLAPDDGRVSADFIADAVASRDIRLDSDGSARRSFCYVADAISGFFTVLLKGNPGEAYNIGDDSSEMSIRELAEMLAGLFPERGLAVVHSHFERAAQPAGPAAFRNASDTSKARALGWKPTVSAAEGFRRAILSCKNAPRHSAIASVAH
jgi:nucleoside-diphosphate-sugar epimerase